MVVLPKKGFAFDVFFNVVGKFNGIVMRMGPARYKATA
jgi:hypothetical protein